MPLALGPLLGVQPSGHLTDFGFSGRTSTPDCEAGCRQYAPCGTHAGQHVGNVLADLVRGFQAEQREVAQQVVVGCQELQVELWQRQARLACSQCGERESARLLAQDHLHQGGQRGAT